MFTTFANPLFAVWRIFAFKVSGNQNNHKLRIIKVSKPFLGLPTKFLDLLSQIIFSFFAIFSGS